MDSFFRSVVFKEGEGGLRFGIHFLRIVWHFHIDTIIEAT